MMIFSRATGKSGTVSRIGRGESLVIRFRTPMVEPARNGEESRGERVEHAAQAEQVAARIDRFAAGLFRGHVQWRGPLPPHFG